MEYIINKIKSMWSTTNKDIDGYFLMEDNKTNKSLVLVKNNEKSWKTEWIDKSITVNKPDKNLNTIFMSL